MRLELLMLLHALAYASACAAASVGDRDTDVRELLTPACSNATTLALLNATSTASSSATDTRAQVIAGGSCEAAVVSAALVPSPIARGTPVLELDARKRGIERVKGIPPSVHVLQLDDNAVEALEPGQGGGNATTYISLARNRIASLAAFAFPASLLTLDLTANALDSIDSAVLPPKLSMLNLTQNPIGSLAFARLPSTLQHLNVAGARLAALEHLSLPTSLLSLNVSGNPIARIAGVRFPASLERLVISSRAQIAAAASPTASKTATAAALAEFEVRRTDAERFRKLQLFHVAATSTRSCSDARAKFVAVNDTVLCVLSDDDFAAKYAHVAAPSGDDAWRVAARSDAPHHKREHLHLLHETWHQRRSWYLVVSALVLGAVVVAIGISSCCQLCVRRAAARYRRRRRRDAGATGSAHKAPLVQMSSGSKRLLATEIETELLLSETNDWRERPAGARSASSNAHSNDDALEPLRRSALSSPIRQLHAASARSSLDDSESVHVTYALARLRDHVVVLKTLHVERKRPDAATAATHRCVSNGSAALQRFMAEIRLHATLSHPHLVRFVGFVRDSCAGALCRTRRLRSDTVDWVEALTLVTEFVPNGTLEDVVATQRARALDASDAIGDGWSWHRDAPTLPSKLSIAIAVARVLAYLHAFEPSLVHGSVSARKVLLDASWRAQLSDLSCCSALQRWSERQQRRTQSTRATLRRSGSDADPRDALDSVSMDMTVWTAPEVIDGQQYTAMADMYSFGVLLTYLATYEFPVDSLLHRVDSDVAILSTSDAAPRLVPVMGTARAPALIRMLGLQCLSFQPEDRLSAHEALDELLALHLDLQDIASSAEVVEYDR